MVLKGCRLRSHDAQGAAAAEQIGIEEQGADREDPDDAADPGREGGEHTQQQQRPRPVDQPAPPDRSWQLRCGLGARGQGTIEQSGQVSLAERIAGPPAADRARVDVIAGAGQRGPVATTEAAHSADPASSGSARSVGSASGLTGGLGKSGSFSFRRSPFAASSTRSAVALVSVSPGSAWAGIAVRTPGMALSCLRMAGAAAPTTTA